MSKPETADPRQQRSTAAVERDAQRGMPARELAKSALVGIWSDRWPDLDAVEVALRLRRDAWQSRDA